MQLKLAWIRRLLSSSRGWTRLTVPGLAFLFGVSVTSTASATDLFADEEATKARVQEIQANVAKLRELAYLRDTSISVETPAEVRAKLEQDVAEHVSDEIFEAVGRTWAAFGLVPSDYDVRESQLRLLQENIGGYYDPETRRLVLVQQSDVAAGIAAQMMADVVIAHELVHSLQDQHFDLHALTDRDLNNSDVEFAIRSMIEGDATLAMLGQMPLAVPLAEIDLQLMKKMMVAAGGAEGAIGNHPLVLTAPLTAPYMEGMVWSHRLLKQGGWETINQSFANPPLSSEHILHPERYGDPAHLPLDLSNEAKGWIPSFQLAFQDSLGEFGLALYLSELAPDIDAASAANGWSGDRIWTFIRDDQTAIVAMSVWDTEPEAVEYAAATQALLATIRPDEALSQTANGFAYESDTVAHGVYRFGDRVITLLDVPTRATKRVLKKAKKVRPKTITSLNDVAPAPEPTPPAQ